MGGDIFAFAVDLAMLFCLLHGKSFLLRAVEIRRTVELAGFQKGVMNILLTWSPQGSCPNIALGRVPSGLVCA